MVEHGVAASESRLVWTSASRRTTGRIRRQHGLSDVSGGGGGLRRSSGGFLAAASGWRGSPAAAAPSIPRNGGAATWNSAGSSRRRQDGEAVRLCTGLGSDAAEGVAYGGGGRRQARFFFSQDREIYQRRGFRKVERQLPFNGGRDSGRWSSGYVAVIWKRRAAIFFTKFSPRPGGILWECGFTMPGHSSFF